MLYQKNRVEKIKQWGLAHQNQTLSNAIDYWQTLNKKQTKLKDQLDEEEKRKQLLNRILTYNKIIAAWVTLIKIEDKTALNELQGLIECEHAA